MGIKVCKFGGSSLCDGERFTKAINIIKSDETRKIVVPSAPGKRFSDDSKVTDLLLSLYDGMDVIEEIKSRYKDIIAYLNLDLDLSNEFKIIQQTIKNGTSIDYVASRGEFLNGMIMASALGFEFIDAATIIKFNQNKELLSHKTLKEIKSVSSNKNVVIPGFYGSGIKNEIVTFSRGGSDITGSLCAAAVSAEVYENWTDVSGFFMADPRIVFDATIIDEVSYKELRELSYMGAGVLHEDSVFPVRKVGIPVNIKNTNIPTDPGTMILPSEQISANSRPITGVAGKKGFAIIKIEKARMNNEVGFARKILTVLENNSIAIEHMPTGIDTLSVIVSEEVIKDKIHKLIREIEELTNPDIIEIYYHMALIATVGHGMVHHPGSASKIFAALSNANINIRMIDQGSSELNIIVGVEEHDYEDAVCEIYHAFI